MKDKVVTTGNITNFISMVQALMNKPERVDRMGLVHGKWGLGKTTAMEWFYSNNICFYSRAWAAWSQSLNMMVEDLLRAYRVEARGRVKQDLRELVRVVKKNRFPLFIDEADRIVRKSILIETIRDIHDFSRVPVILIGQENILNMLQRKDLGQVFSRITEIVEFKPLNAQNIQDISRELCDLKCNMKVASFIRNVTLGDFRLVNALLIKAEDICILNKVSEVSLATAKEASKVLPNPDDIKKAVERGSLDIDSHQPLTAINQ